MWPELERELHLARPDLEGQGRAARERVRRQVARRPGATARGWRLSLPGRRRGFLVLVLALVAAGGTAVAIGLSRGGAPPQTAAPPTGWGGIDVLAYQVDFPPPAAGLDARGDALVAWVRGGRVEARWRPPHGRWSQTAVLSSPGVQATGVQVALAPDGQALLVYRERRGGRLSVRVTRFPSGKVAAVLRKRTDYRYVLVARSWSPAAGFGPARVAAPIGRNQRDLLEPQVGVDANGRFTIAWARAGRVETRAAQAGRLGPIEVVADEHGANIRAPALAVSRSGRALLAWGTLAHTTPPGVHVRAALFEDGRWTPAQTLSTAGYGTGGPQLNAHFATALDDRGDALVAWSSGAPFGTPGRGAIQVARRGPGAAFRPPEPVGAGPHPVGAAAAGVDGSGRFVLVWTSGTVEHLPHGAVRINPTTLSASARPGGGWSPVERVSASGQELFTTRPVPVASDGAGGLIGVWQGPHGLLARAWPSGGTGWSAAVPISRGSPFDYMGATVALAGGPDGRAVYAAARSARHGLEIVAFVREPDATAGGGGT